MRRCPLGEIRLLPPERTHLALPPRPPRIAGSLVHPISDAPTRVRHTFSRALTPRPRPRSVSAHPVTTPPFPPLPSPPHRSLFRPRSLCRIATPGPERSSISLEGRRRPIPAERRRIATTLSPTQSHGRRTLGRAGGLHVHTIRLCTHRATLLSDTARRPGPPTFHPPPRRRNRPPPHRSCSTDPFRPAIIHRCS